jgi:hypothetical protein
MKALLWTLAAVLLLAAHPHEETDAQSRIRLRQRVGVGAGVATIDCSANTCYYIRDGGSASITGTGACVSTGSGNWNTANACDDLPATLVRGAYYLVATGTYAGKTLSTANSGTTAITIQGATASSHGTSTGWVNSYSVAAADGGAQAIWGNHTATTDYWTFDGAVGGLADSSLSSQAATRSTYGFAVTQTVAGAVDAAFYINTSSSSRTNITIKHVAFKAPGTFATTDETAIRNTIGSNKNLNLWAYSNLFDQFQGDFVSEGSGGSVTGWLIEYNYILNHFSNSAHHGESVNANNDIVSPTIRYNRFVGASGTGSTGCITANNAALTSPAIYGNVFKSLVVTNGIITSTSTGTMSGALVYNNTFDSNSDPFDGTVNWVNTSPAGSATSYNNLIYNQTGNVDGTHDYNYYVSLTNGLPTETNRQTASGDPFVSRATGDYHLAAASNAGTTLASPYTLDPLGNTRGADGTWDRGAYEFCSGGCTFALLEWFLRPPAQHARESDQQPRRRFWDDANIVHAHRGGLRVVPERVRAEVQAVGTSHLRLPRPVRPRRHRPETNSTKIPGRLVIQRGEQLSLGVSHHDVYGVLRQPVAVPEEHRTQQLIAGVKRYGLTDDQIKGAKVWRLDVARGSCHQQQELGAISRGDKGHADSSINLVEDVAGIGYDAGQQGRLKLLRQLRHSKGRGDGPAGQSLFKAAVHNKAGGVRGCGQEADPNGHDESQAHRTPLKWNWDRGAYPYQRMRSTSTNGFSLLEDFC